MPVMNLNITQVINSMTRVFLVLTFFKKHVIFFIVASHFVIAVPSYSGEKLTKSEHLDELITNLKTYSRSETLSVNEKQQLRNVDSFSYFVNHIDEVETLENAKLEGYLLGLNKAYEASFLQQVRTNSTLWFCPRTTIALSVNFLSDKSSLFMENLIYETIEKLIILEPERFDKENYHNLMKQSVSEVVTYGLQTKYPCYQPVPEEHRIDNLSY